MGREVQRKEILSDIMNIKSKSSHFYQLDNHIIGAGKNKYLALPISDDLKWSSHIHKITSKPNCTLRFLHYNLHQDSKSARKSHISLSSDQYSNVVLSYVTHIPTKQSIKLKISKREPPDL